MRFLIDAQLPPSLARLLKAAGHEAEHVEDVGLRDAGDHQIWNYAVQQQAVVITKDEDFTARLSREGSGPAIVWLRVGNCTRRVLLKWFDPLLPSILEHLHQGERVIELRR